MASTSQLLTWIELELHGWQREGSRGSRALFNEAHRILNIAEREQNLLWDDTTGEFPYLTTQNGVYRYDMPSTVWRIAGVAVDDLSMLPNSSAVNRQWRYEDMEIAGITLWRILNITSRDQRRGQNAFLRFIGMNPGATTEVFRRVAYRLPVEILSDSIQHEFPGDTDVRFGMQATMMLADAIDDHSKMVNTRRYLEEVLRPQYQSEIDGGEQGTSGFAIKRAW